MRILHAIASIDSAYGGPVSALRGLCRGLNKLHVQQTVLTSSTGDSGWDEANALMFNDVEVIWTKPLVSRFYWEPFLEAKIGKIAEMHDLFHIHGVFNGVCSAAFKTARRRNIPFVAEPFGTLSPYCLKKSRLLKKISLFLGERSNIESASAVRFSSGGESSRFKQNFSARKNIIAGMGLNWDEFATLPDKGFYREHWNIKDHEAVFLFLGRLHPIKGLEIFLPAFGEWLQEGIESARLVIVGPDETGYAKKLKALVAKLGLQDKVVFAGSLYGLERIKAIVDANVVVLPSHHENFGIAAAEGMACGKPVLVSDQVDLWPEVLRHGLGEVASMNKKSMMNSLRKLMANKEKWSSIGDRSFRWAKQNCDWENISAKLYEEYTQILFEGRSDE